MKRFVLVGLTAKFIHSSLALRYLEEFEGNRHRHALETVELTVNHRPDFILQELYRRKPDALFFSCYIWNIEFVKQLCPELRKILPHCALMVGGPEVSFDSEEFLRQNPAVDAVLRGEGEETFTELLDALEQESPDYAGIPGLTCRQEETLLRTPDRPLLDLARLPFPYVDFSGVRDKILYYESARGCPYQCSYCLSSVEKGVRFVPLDKVFQDLQRFLDAKVRQVKFVDRTFNCNRARTMAVWAYLLEHDNGVTNFHFELTADLLDDGMIEFLRQARPGMFQFEIGVQSTNPHTMRAIRRQVDFGVLSHMVRRIKAGGNIHQHLDLIAGLPWEDYASFGRSFNDVYALEPEQLQLGFLKVLKGSPLCRQAEEYGIQHRSYAPYEVLQTRWLSYADLLRLSVVEEMVELFYNSGRFGNTLPLLTACFPSPFACYEHLARQWVDTGRHLVGHNTHDLCGFLYETARCLPGYQEERFLWTLKYDLCLHEKPKKFPAWLDRNHNQEYRERMLAFYRSEANLRRFLPQYLGQDHRHIYRLAHIEVFGDRPEHHRAVLFDYDHRDLLGNAAAYPITL